jgi:multidrug efflux pump
VLGHFPLILASGAGAAARHSIGIVLVAGMTIGTLFTLLIVPSLYMLISPPSEMRNKTIGFESAPDSLTGNASI